MSESNGTVGVVARYAFGLGLVGLTALIQLLLDRALSGNFPFIMMYGVVAVVVCVCGWLPATMTALTGFFTISFLFVHPRISFPTMPLLTTVAVFSYFTSIGLIIWMGESMRRQKRAAEERGERLEKELARRYEAEDSLRQRNAELDAAVAAKEALRIQATERAAEFKALLDAAPMPVWISHDAHGRHITGNAYADEIVMRAVRGTNVSRSASDSAVAYRVLKNGVGLSPEELPVQRACATGEPMINEELQLIFPDDRSVYLLMNATPLFDERGHVRGCIAAGADITQLKRVVSELREAHSLLGNRAVQLEKIVAERTTKLRETLHELEAFAYQLVHDLRAPLVTIQSFSRLLTENVNDPGPLNHIRKIAASAEKMDTFVHDVLRYSRLLQAPVEMEPVDVGAILQSCLGSFQSFQQPNSEIHLAGEFPLVHGNKSALTECVLQLLNNAVKFVAPGAMPVVRVWCNTRDGWSTLYFEDNGIGIPKSAQGKIFEVFQRLDKGYDGSGIGLTIVKKAVERMGGKVGLQSEPGAGCLFWLELKHVGAVQHTDARAPRLARN